MDKTNRCTNEQSEMLKIKRKIFNLNTNKQTNERRQKKRYVDMKRKKDDTAGYRLVGRSIGRQVGSQVGRANIGKTNKIVRKETG